MQTTNVQWMWLLVPLALAFGLAGVIAALRQLLYVCEPNEVLVFSGRSHRASDGSLVGFRVVTAGRAVRIPIVERVDRLDVSSVAVSMMVNGAYSQGGIPLAVQAFANVKISTDPLLLPNAIERFLGRTPEEIGRVAKETLEGHLRGVLASLTPEEVNEDRLKFAEQLSDEASTDLAKLGIALDLLKIQAVSDERNYLASIGRTRIAEIVRAAEEAESDAQRAAEEAEAQSTARAAVAVQQAEAVIEQKRAQLRQERAEREAEARAEEERAQQAALAARAEAETHLWTLRGELERLRLLADVSIPADVDRQVQTLSAEGHAAATAEQGRAAAAAMSEVSKAWQACGVHAAKVAVAQHLTNILAQVKSRAAAATQLPDTTIIDSGDGESLALVGRAHARAVASLLEELRTTLGVDVAGVLRGEPTADPLVAHTMPAIASDRVAS